VDIETRRGFLNLAALFEGGVFALALLLGWCSETLRPESVRFLLHDVGWGLVAVVPMLVIFVVAKQVRREATEVLGKSLALCRWYDLAALALLAGLGEELLFRGVVQPWIGERSVWGAVVLANLLFGLAHALSLSYFLLAAAIGIYFSWLTGGLPGVPVGPTDSNLLRPIVAHAVYDFLAFLLIVREYRSLSASPPASSTSDGNPTGPPCGPSS
jgi:membrane protease YdiL (CAAX protease family)